jgi:hypothetical protein
MITPKKVDPKPTESIVILYDVRLPGAADRLHEGRAAWRECGDVEALDQNHYVLIIRSGEAREMVA